MLFSPEHFWGEVVQSPAESISSFLRGHCPPKICNFNSTSRYQNVLRFQITVNNVPTVQVLNSRTYLFYHKGYFILRQSVDLFDEVKELTFGSVFQNESDRRGVPEIAVEFENCGVVEGRLNDDLSFDLLAVPILVKFLPVHAFESHDKVGHFLASNVNLSELAATCLLNDIKICQRKRSRPQRLFWCLTAPKHNNKI